MSDICSPIRKKVKSKEMQLAASINKRSESLKRKFISFGEQRALRKMQTQGVRVGNHIFVGGQILSTSAARSSVDITTQARNAFEAVKRVLAEAGATMADVVKHNVISTAMAMKLRSPNSSRSQSGSPKTTSLILALQQREIRAGLSRKGHRSRGRVGRRWRRKATAAASRTLELEQETALLSGLEGRRHDLRRRPAIARSKWPCNWCRRHRSADRQHVSQSRHDAEGRLVATQRHLMRQNTYYRFSGQGPEVTDFWEKMTKVRQRFMSVPSSAGAGIRMAGFPLSEELIQVEGIGVLGEHRHRLHPENHWDWSIPNSQFTQGWQVGNLAFIGGQISADNKAHAVGKDLATQTRNVFKFIRSVLREAGLDERDVVKLYIYYYAGDEWGQITKAMATIEDIQREFYPEPGPASTAVRATGFAFEDLLIEIEAMAVRRD